MAGHSYKAVRSPHQSHKESKKQNQFSRGVAQFGMCEASAAKRHSAVRSPHQSHKGSKAVSGKRQNKF